MVVFHGISRVRLASRLQKVVTLSSGEAELNAHVLGHCSGLGLGTLCEEWGLPSGAESLSDSSAAHGIASQVGSCKLEHVQDKQVWTQDVGYHC